MRAEPEISEQELYTGVSESEESIIGEEIEGESEELNTGDVVTFSYSKFTANGKPVNARDFRVRKDLKWQHVLDDFANEVPRPLSENSMNAKQECTSNTDSLVPSRSFSF